MTKDKKKTVFLNQPVYPGGVKALSQFIYSNLQYPESALADRVEGTVVLEYDIDNRGMVVDTRILKSLGPVFDAEAQRVARLLLFDVPTNRNMRVLFHRKLHVKFTPPPPAPPPQVDLQVQYTLTPMASKTASINTTPSYTYTVQFANDPTNTV